MEGPIVPDLAIINVACLIEKDLSEFYNRMAEQTEGEARKALHMLSQWEKDHERFFKEYRDKLSEVYTDIFQEG